MQSARRKFSGGPNGGRSNENDARQNEYGSPWIYWVFAKASTFVIGLAGQTVRVTFGVVRFASFCIDLLHPLTRLAFRFLDNRHEVWRCLGTPLLLGISMKLPP